MPARDFALIELDAKKLPGWPPHQLRAVRRKVGTPTDPRDRGLAEQIVVGVVKNLLHLQWLIRHYSQRSLKSVDPLTQKILAMGLYQLRFLDRIPSAVAVHEAVEQAKRFGLGRAAGFINAVLRKATTDAPPATPDREKAPADYAELVLSHPRAVFLRLEKLVGREQALALCEHDNAEPPTVIRLYAGAGLEHLHADGTTVTPHEQAGLYVVKPTRPAQLAEWARRGVAQVQDPTAALVVPHLGLAPGQTVLDRCCGLGTKTLQMREGVGETGRVLAVDPSTVRCETLVRSIEERGVGNIIVRPVGMMSQLSAEDPREFDRVLIDAPCSNSGVLARRPEARYSQTAESLRSLAQLQDRILEDTAGTVKPGGRVVYSTCSIWPEENEERVRAFLGRHPEYRLVKERTTLPSVGEDPTRYRDGGYFAVMERVVGESQ